MSIHPWHGFTAACDRCGETAEDYDDGRILLFQTPADAVRTLVAGEWFAMENLTGCVYAVCFACVQRSACELTGHTYSEWIPVVSPTYVGQWRTCECCHVPETDPPLDPVDSDPDVSRRDGK